MHSVNQVQHFNSREVIIILCFPPVTIYATVPLLSRVSSWKGKGEMEGGEKTDIYLCALYRMTQDVMEFFSLDGW